MRSPPQFICLFSRSAPMTRSCKSLRRWQKREEIKYVIVCADRGRPRPLTSTSPPLCRSQCEADGSVRMQAAYRDRPFPRRYVRHLSCSEKTETGRQDILLSAYILSGCSQFTSGSVVAEWTEPLHTVKVNVERYLLPTEEFKNQWFLYLQSGTSFCRNLIFCIYLSTF